MALTPVTMLRPGHAIKTIDGTPLRVLEIHIGISEVEVTVQTSTIPQNLTFARSSSVQVA